VSTPETTPDETDAPDNVTGMTGARAAKAKAKPSSKSNKVSTNDRIRWMASLGDERYEVGRNLEGQAWVRSRLGAPVTRLLENYSAELGAELARTLEIETGEVFSSYERREALLTLSDRAWDTDPVPTAVRIANPTPDSIAVDLGNCEGEYVLITREGWRITTERSRVIFLRGQQTKALPTPIRGGDLSKLWQLMNISEKMRPMVLANLICSMFKFADHPILSLKGQPGAAKTTTAGMYAFLLDPVEVGEGQGIKDTVIALPDDVRDIYVTAGNRYFLTYDNIDSMSNAQQTALSIISTGGMRTGRTLYTNSNASSIPVRGCLTITSIDPGRLKADFLDRLISVDVEPIPGGVFKTAAEIRRQFDAMHPEVLGGLFDLAAGVLANLDDVRRDMQRRKVRVSRMADFSYILATIDKLTGTTGFVDFMAARDEAQAEVAQDNIILDTLMKLIDTEVPEDREGIYTPTELLAALLRKWRELTNDPYGKPPAKIWPDTPSYLSRQLVLLSMPLEKSGYRVVRRASNGKRLWVLSKAAPEPTPPPTSPDDDQGDGGLPLDEPTPPPGPAPVLSVVPEPEPAEPAVDLTSLPEDITLDEDLAAADDDSGPRYSQRQIKPWTVKPSAYIDLATGTGVVDGGTEFTVRRRGKLATLAELLTALPTDVRYVHLTGTLPGGGDSAAVDTWTHGKLPEGWSESPREHDSDERRNRVSLRYIRPEGTQVTIYRSSIWIGDDAETNTSPADLEAATALLVRGIGETFGTVCGEQYGVPLKSTPASTGLELIRRTLPRDKRYPILDSETQRLIRRVGGQARTEHYSTTQHHSNGAHVPDEIPGLHIYDARFAYGALFDLELPFGPVERDHVAEIALREGSKTSWEICLYRLRVTVPANWDAVGPWRRRDERGVWVYPDTPGETFETWAWDRTLRSALASNDGWTLGETVQILERARFTGGRGKPLQTFGRHLVALRNTWIPAQTDASDTVRELARTMARQIAIGAIGKLSGTPYYRLRTIPIDDPTGPPTDRVWLSEDEQRWEWREPVPGQARDLAHPEWSSYIWSTARDHLYSHPTQAGVGIRHVPRAELIAARTDGYWTSTPQPAVADTDDGKIGRLRPQLAHTGTLETPRTLEALNLLRKRLEAGQGR
jgi:hypothetical protein